MKDLGNKPVMAANVKRYMREKGINAKELSRALNVPYTTVLSWVNAEYYPRIDKIEKMSEYFGCLKSDLIEDKEKPATDDGNELTETQKEFRELGESMSDDQLRRFIRIAKAMLEEE